jgi:flagellin-specific chaperone FliS
VGELAGALDRAGGGALAENLDRLYEFSSRRLGEAAATREARPLAEVAVLLEGLLDAWRQAYEKFKPTTQHPSKQERSP